MVFNVALKDSSIALNTAVYYKGIPVYGNRGRPWPREREGPATKEWEGFSFLKREYPYSS